MFYSLGAGSLLQARKKTYYTEGLGFPASSLKTQLHKEDQPCNPRDPKGTILILDPDNPTRYCSKNETGTFCLLLWTHILKW